MKKSLYILAASCALLNAPQAHAQSLQQMSASINMSLQQQELLATEIQKLKHRIAYLESLSGGSSSPPVSNSDLENDIINTISGAVFFYKPLEGCPEGWKEDDRFKDAIIVGLDKKSGTTKALIEFTFDKQPKEFLQAISLVACTPKLRTLKTTKEYGTKQPTYRRR